MTWAEFAAGLLWIGFVVVWQLILSRWTAKAITPSSRSTRIGWSLAYAVGFSLLFGPFWQWGAFAAQPFRRPVWHTPPLAAWALVLAEAGFFAFGFWARAHLGTLWSGMMTLRDGHRVVDTGPYRLVRHPIYTCFIGAAWMLALIGAAPERLLGAAILTLVMAVKAKAEEALLRRELGTQAYDAYAARTPMLVPFAPR